MLNGEKPPELERNSGEIGGSGDGIREELQGKLVKRGNRGEGQKGILILGKWKEKKIWAKVKRDCCRQK